MNGDEEYLDDGFEEENYQDQRAGGQQDAVVPQQLSGGQSQNFMDGGEARAMAVVGNSQIQNELVDKEVE